MSIKNIGFIGVRTSKYQETVTLFKDCLEVPVTLDTSSKMTLTLNDRTKLELYGPEDEFHSFFNTGPVVGFTVSDFKMSKQRMISHGVKFIGNPQNVNDISWQHFYLPDGTIAEILGSDSK